MFALLMTIKCFFFIFFVLKTSYCQLCPFSLDSKSFDKTPARKTLKKNHTLFPRNDHRFYLANWNVIMIKSQHVPNRVSRLPISLLKIMQQQQHFYQHQNNPQMKVHNKPQQRSNDCVSPNHLRLQNHEELPQEHTHSFIVTLLEIFITYLFFHLNNKINFAESKQIYRLVHLIHTQAKTIQQNGH